MGPIEALLAEDHDRIEKLLGAVLADGAGDLAAYDEFRGALLRHIGIEEKILGPEASARGANVAELRARLREDHSRLAHLLTLRPTRELIAGIEAVLGPHNALEEGPEGFYALCDAALRPDLEGVLARIEAAPPVVLRALPAPGERPKPRPLPGRSS